VRKSIGENDRPVGVRERPRGVDSSWRGQVQRRESPSFAGRNRQRPAGPFMIRPAIKSVRRIFAPAQPRGSIPSRCVITPVYR